MNSLNSLNMAHRRDSSRRARRRVEPGTPRDAGRRLAAAATARRERCTQPHRREPAEPRPADGSAPVVRRGLRAVVGQPVGLGLAALAPRLGPVLGRSTVEGIPQRQPRGVPQRPLASGVGESEPSGSGPGGFTADRPGRAGRGRPPPARRCRCRWAARRTRPAGWPDRPSSRRTAPRGW